MAQPFGEESCEHEVVAFGPHYRAHYFDETQFNDEALKSYVYLIIGRRGSGKTSLSEHFKFQDVLPGARCIDVNEPEAYDEAIRALRKAPEELLPEQLGRVWEHIIWTLIFNAFRDRSQDIARACGDVPAASQATRIVRDVIRALTSRFLNEDGTLRDEAESVIGGAATEDARKAVLAITANEPIIVAFDTLEQYDVTDNILMRTTAALVMAASRMNMKYSSGGIHVKMFLSAEISPHLTERVIINTVKYVREPLYLHWRPKDLLRLVSWRFYRYLQDERLCPAIKVDWGDYKQVLENVWAPYFGTSVLNGFNQAEASFPYVLRHTQLRPRELVVLCNKIARLSQERGAFPKMPASAVRDGIREGESGLAVGVINSYEKVYANAGDIIRRGLSKGPVIFEGSVLDKIAPSTASLWEAEYTRESFKRLVFELGVVGRVRQFEQASGIVAADFEYSMKAPLTVRDDDLCVLHPMFIDMLKPTFPNGIKLRIYPFPGSTEGEIFGSEGR